MPSATSDYYSSYDTVLPQARRMSSPFINHTSSPISTLSMPRRYSVQIEGSPYMSQPGNFLSTQQYQCVQKPALRSTLSAPIPQLAQTQTLLRKDSLKSTSDSVCSSTSELARYKTELCRPFEETGQCRYGAKCQFAHGTQELRSLNRHPKYKTELCRTFHTTGFCSYGQRCNFIHNDEERRIAAPSASSQTSSISQVPLPKIIPYDFPLTINSTGDSPASSDDGGSPSHSPCYLNDDVFTKVRLSPTPSYGSDSTSLGSSSHYSPPRSPKHDQDESTVVSALDMGLGLSWSLKHLAL